MNRLLVVKKSLTLSITMMLAHGILLSNVGAVAAQDSGDTPGGNIPAALSQQQGPTDPAELEAFLDELMAKDMEEYHVAGAAVSVVKDGEVFFAKGYGYADLENDIFVDPEDTIFAIGSVGKLFTWTAVMQLAEQGKLDLDADVNTYLDFRIPATYSQPVTLKHLMTHTSGFEERWAGSVVWDASDLVPAREWLVSHMAARVRPPGESAAYSNYNAMLAGYIVTQVSGQPYGKYVQEHILDPLGMVHSTAQDPLPPDLRLHASLGYTYVDGAFRVFPHYRAQPALMPSGWLQASVSDMARFMIAHLQDGRYSDANIAEARILEEATARQMHLTQHTPDPRFLGMALGFFELSHNGQRTIGHRGFSGIMHSLLLLLPNQDLGVFVVYNSAGGGNLADPHFGFQRAFYDHYFPAPAAESIRSPESFAARAGRFAGSYRMTAFPETSYLKVGDLLGMFTQEIIDSGDGALLVTYSGSELRFAEVEPLYFRQVEGPFSIIFQEDDQGRISSMFMDPVNFTAYEKLDWYETSGFQMPLFLVCVLIFLSVIPMATIRIVRDRGARGDLQPAARGAHLSYWVILGISLLNLLVVVGTALGAMASMQMILIEPPLIVKFALTLGVLSPVLTVGALAYTVVVWRKGYWEIIARLHYTLVTVAAVVFVWFMNYWNLLGLRY